MNKKLKVYTVHDDKTRYLVATTSLKAAAKLFEVSMYYLTQDGGLANLDSEPELYSQVISQPGIVFRRPLNYQHRDSWTPILLSNMKKYRVHVQPLIIAVPEEIDPSHPDFEELVKSAAFIQVVKDDKELKLFTVGEEVKDNGC